MRSQHYFHSGMAMNLEAYFERIGYTGEAKPTLDVLQAISLLHACSIPFENLDIPLGHGISLEEEAVDRKLVHARRGGYCFEQNFLLMRVLKQIGFAVTPLSARVRVQAHRDFIPARTHLFLRVEIDGVPWMADVGIGSLSLTTPIRLDWLDIEQPTSHEPRRVIRENRLPFPVYYHQAKLGNEWCDVSEFTFEEMPPVDRELGNWWTSTNPNSKFAQNLFAARALPDGSRISINNHEFTHRRNAEILERFEIVTNDQLLSLLASRFGMMFANDTRFWT